MRQQGEPWEDRSEYAVYAWLRCLQLHIDPNKMRFQFLMKLPDGDTALTQENAHLVNFTSVLAVRMIGGQTAVHPRASPFFMGWRRLSWEDCKYLHHATTEAAWPSIQKWGIIPGGLKSCPRAEAFYSASSYVLGMGRNPHTKIPPYKFNNRHKTQIDIVVNMQAACAAGVVFWIGDQNAIMTEGTVLPTCILQARRIDGTVLGAKPAAPFRYPPLEKRAHARTMYEVVDSTSAVLEVVPANPRPPTPLVPMVPAELYPGPPPRPAAAAAAAAAVGHDIPPRPQRPVPKPDGTPAAEGTFLSAYNNQDPDQRPTPPLAKPPPANVPPRGSAGSPAAAPPAHQPAASGGRPGMERFGHNPQAAPPKGWSQAMGTAVAREGQPAVATTAPGHRLASHAATGFGQAASTTALCCACCHPQAGTRGQGLPVRRACCCQGRSYQEPTWWKGTDSHGVCRLRRGCALQGPAGQGVRAAPGCRSGQSRCARQRAAYHGHIRRSHSFQTASFPRNARVASPCGERSAVCRLWQRTPADAAYPAAARQPRSPYPALA